MGALSRLGRQEEARARALPTPPSSTRPLPGAHLTALHGAAQVAQQAIRYSHVILAHGPVLEAPAFAVVVDELCSLAGEEQGFLVVLQGTKGGARMGGRMLSGGSCP